MQLVGLCSRPQLFWAVGREQMRLVGPGLWLVGVVELVVELVVGVVELVVGVVELVVELVDELVGLVELVELGVDLLFEVVPRLECVRSALAQGQHSLNDHRLSEVEPVELVEAGLVEHVQVVLKLLPLEGMVGMAYSLALVP